MDIPVGVTVALLILFILIGLVPKIPEWVRFVVVLVGGVIVYVGFSEAMFAMPTGEDSAISILFGGKGYEEGFNFLSMGVVCTVIGLLFTTVGAVLRKLLGKKEE